MMSSVCKITLSGLLLAALAGFGQSFLGSIGGAVTDPSTAVVPQAKVELTEVTTGIRRTAETNLDGLYLFADLPPGNYVVAVSAAGFKGVRSSNIILTAQQKSRFDAALQVGESAQTIDVMATPPTLNTENAQLGDLRPRQELLNLPTNSRSTLTSQLLTSYNYTTSGNMGGLRGNNTNFTIDGITSNSSIFGGSVGNMIEETMDSVREVKMLSSNNSAEFAKVATMIVASRSGENQWHGSAFLTANNFAFDARNFFSPSKPKGPEKYMLGGSLGGPVMLPKIYNGHNKTFFYFTWEQNRWPGAQTFTGNVPTLKMRAGDFSDLLPGKVITDPTTGSPFSGNIIPSSRISPVSLKMQDFGFLPPNFGAPNTYTANWRGLGPSNEVDERFVIRGDHRLGNRDALSARSSYHSDPIPIVYDADLPIFYRHMERQDRNVYVSETHTFGPRLLNELRLAFARDYAHMAGIHQGAQVIQQIGLQGVDLSSRAGLAGVPSVNFVNFSNWKERVTYFYLSQTYELLDNVTWVKGNHSIKSGILLHRNTPAISEQPSSDFGSMSFDGFASGFDDADFLLGLPHSSGRYTRAQPRYNRYGELGLFVQDDFQVTPRLTLNLGLRYEYFPPPTDKNNMRFTMDLATGNLVVPNEKVLNTLVNPVFPKSIPIVTAQTAGFPSPSLLEPDRKNFSPRVGFAYRPSGNSHLVIRGGYGIYYTNLVYTLLESFAGGPFHSDERFQNSIANGVPQFQFPNPFPGVGAIPTQSVQPVSKSLRTPYVQQWNLTLERELPHSIVGRFSYRGLRNVRVPYVADLNMPPPSTNPDNKNWFRYPNFYSVTYVQDGGIQKMNALDVGVERKFARGLTFQSGWTWAKNLSDVGNDGENASIENPYDRKREMADVNWMPRHRFVSELMYEIPFGKGQRFGASLPRVVTQSLGNWQISAITLFQTGQFLTPAFSGSAPSNTRTVGGRPDWVGNWEVPNQSIYQWFNPAAFAVPPNGRFGNSARGVIVGPGVANVNFGLFKYVNVTERARLQLRMTAGNFFNHPNFGNPNTNISSGSVGRITSLVSGTNTLSGGARQIQLGFRFDF